MSSHYSLTCLETGTVISDELLPLSNPGAVAPAFLRTRYATRKFSPGPHDSGIYRFADWLPIRRTLEGSSAPITYRSTALADHLGLSRLFITFSGYWPERGARMLTGTFKECEAFSVCARVPEDYDRVLVVASAGNTARAFARVCSENAIPLVVVMPERNLDSLWNTAEIGPTVRVIAAAGDSDYSDAIALSALIASLPGYVAEGGAKNVARRDGMATTVLSAVDAMGELPKHYFQAVGSGTGAIAAWEATLRLIESGDYGQTKMRLHVSQNAPFAPIHEAWQRRSRDLAYLDPDVARALIDQIDAKVLANRNPPYGLRGGLFDALHDTDGTTGVVDNATAALAGDLFSRLEGIDVAPAASVAVAHLISAVRDRTVGPDDPIMLNVTGGGYQRVSDDFELFRARPARVIPRERFTLDAVADAMTGLF